MLTKILKAGLVAAALFLFLLPLFVPASKLAAEEDRHWIAPDQLAVSHQELAPEQVTASAGPSESIEALDVKKEAVEVNAVSAPVQDASAPSTEVIEAEGVAVASSDISHPAPIPVLSEAEAKEEIANRESGGSYTAQNGQYYGRYQLTITYLNGDLSPENQERVADAYVATRYGSWVEALAFWNLHGWY